MRTHRGEAALLLEDIVPIDPHRAANLANWEDRVPIHNSPAGYDLDRLVDDPDALSGTVTYDAARLGELRGLEALHLQCHLGTDTLSLARLGATVTGLDFSPSALAVARELFARTGTTGRFVESEVYDAREALAGETFDLVYTGVGALCWLPDVRAWAQVVAALLSPGGRLFLRESHPMLDTLDEQRDDGLLVVAYPYFQTAQPQRWEEAISYAGEGEIAHPVNYTWNHGIGELITAVLDAGLQLTGFEEHREYFVRFLPTMVRDGNEYVLPDRPERLPMAYTLQAVKPG